MSQIRFEDPSPHRRRKFDWEAIAEELRAHPNQWAIVAENDYTGVASQIKNGTYKAFRPVGRWEATVRGVDLKTGKAAKIYARYVN